MLFQMTGLNSSTDTILSISCILTDSHLQFLDREGFDAVISHTKAQLDSMSQWCIDTHGKSGLTQACLSSKTTAETAATELLAYVKKFIPDPRRALLAGNSIHADRSFLAKKPWNVILEHLHYRLFDVSAMKEMMRRWAPDHVLEQAPRKALKHTAREDVEESITEAKYYMSLIRGFAPSHPETTLLGRASAMLGIDGADDGGKPLALGTKQGQEAYDMIRNNGNKMGDAGEDNEGFRTDVP
jgi:oligoribonuclease